LSLIRCAGILSDVVLRLVIASPPYPHDFATPVIVDPLTIDIEVYRPPLSVSLSNAARRKKHLSPGRHRQMALLM
jgi:hypothetical protein